jgi:hypothetical protein
MDASAKDLARAKFRGQHGRGRRPPPARAAGQAAVPEQGRRAAPSAGTRRAADEVPLAHGLTRQAVLRWVVADDEAGGGAADARRSAGADLAELLEAAEHSAPAATRFRGHATADDDLLAPLGDGPDEQARGRPAPQPAPLPSPVGSARAGG